MMLVGILPTISDQHLNGEALSANPRYRLLNEQIFAARGEDLQISITGQERLSTFADTIAPEAACTSVQLHQHGRPREVRHALERGAGDRRRAARGRRQLAVLLRPRAVAGDADRALRAGHRHAAGGAQGPGRAPARVVRRALDHLDLRPLRGERHLLPGAAAGVRRPRTRSRCSSAGGVPALAELRLHNGTDLPLEPADLRRRARQAAPARREPRAARRPDRRRHARQRRLLLRARARCSPTRSARSGRGCRSRRRRRTSTPARATASTRACSGPGSARCRPPSSCCGGCCRSPTRGSSRWGIDAGDRDRLLGIIEQRCTKQRNGATWQAETFHRLYDDKGLERARRAARDDGPLPRPHARQRAGPRLARRRLSHINK